MLRERSRTPADLGTSTSTRMTEIAILPPRGDIRPYRGIIAVYSHMGQASASTARGVRASVRHIRTPRLRSGDGACQKLGAREDDGRMSVERSEVNHALAVLGIPPASVTDLEPLAGGLSGATLANVTLTQRHGNASAYARRVVKVLRTGWLQELTHDTALREAQVWRSGLLARLPRTIETAYCAVSSEPDQDQRCGALLMRNVSSRLWPSAVRTPPGRRPAVTDAIVTELARMHARFWEYPCLRDPAVGLMRTTDAMLFLSPQVVTAQRASGQTNPYLPLAEQGWATFFEVVPPTARATLVRVFADPSPWLRQIDSLPRTLVHGDVWGPNLGVLPAGRGKPARLLLLDWALTTAGPATWDVLWLCGTWQGLSPVRTLALYRARLRHEFGKHGIAFKDATWRLLVEAGYLRTTLTCGEAFGQAVHHARSAPQRNRAVARARWWGARAALAAERLANSGGEPGIRAETAR